MAVLPERHDEGISNSVIKAFLAGMTEMIMTASGKGISSNHAFSARTDLNPAYKTLCYQQHPPEESPHPQEGSLPVSRPVMIAEAQPTPAFTEMAPESQFFAQAPHSMQRSLSVIAARLSFMTKTPRGQTSTHLRQPVHFSGAKRSVVTSAR
jgi:hypothetical protein